MKVVVDRRDRRVWATFILPNEPIDLRDVERSFIAQALERTEGNQVAAARLLGITRFALRHRIDKYGLRVVDEGSSA